MTRELRHAQELQADFLAKLSHDLRTPLTSLREFVSILQDGLAGDLTSTQREYLAIAMRNADTLSEMLEHLLVLTRIQQGRYRIFCSRVSLHELFSDGALISVPKPVGKQVSVRAQIPPTVPDVFADSDRIREAVRNLVDNAVKYSGDSVDVTIEAAEGFGSMVDLAVRDNGRGMDPSTLKYLFRRFYRGRWARADSPRGLGLGLAIVKEIIDRHGGKISVRSVPGKGTEFRLSLPKYEPTGILIGSLRNAWRSTVPGGVGFSFVESGVRGWTGALSLPGNEMMQLVRESYRRALGPDDSMLTNGEGDRSICLLLAGEKRAMRAAARRLQRNVAERLCFQSGIEIEWGGKPLLIHSRDYRNPEQMAEAILRRECAVEGIADGS